MLTDRRHALAILAATVATPAFGQSMSRVTAYAFSFAGLDGGDIKLADHAGKPILIVNIHGFWDPLIALFGRMTGEGFLHKEFLGDHVDLPVRFCATAEAVVPTLQAAIAGVPRPELEEARGVRAM